MVHGASRELWPLFSNIEPVATTYPKLSPETLRKVITNIDFQLSQS
jgi:hypothetical protein